MEICSEIQKLYDGIEQQNRALKSIAIQEIKLILNNAITNGKFDEAENLFIQLDNLAQKHVGQAGFAIDEFKLFIEKQIQLAKKNKLVWLTVERNIARCWKHSAEVSILANAMEELAECSTGIVRIATLKRARAFYRKLHNAEKESVLTTRITNETIAFQNLISHSHSNVTIPPVFQDIKNQIAEALQKWNNASPSVKFDYIVTGLPFCKQPSSFEEDPDSLVDCLEAAGVIQTVMLSHDGRISTNNIPAGKRRRHFECFYKTIFISLNAFAEPVSKWLLDIVTIGDQSCKTADLVITDYSDLPWADESSSEILCQGLYGYIHKNYAYSISMLLPNFEGALRQFLIEQGENVINSQERKGIEDFVLFDGLLRKAEKYFSEETLLYWRYIFSTYEGVGFNFRNLFCHSAFPIKAYNQINALMILIGYFFLFDPITVTNNPVVFTENN